jgi:hypothetical protein
MAESSSTLKYRRPPNIVAREVGGEQVLLPLRRRAVDLSAVYVLNAVAKAVWVQLDGHTDVEEIIEKIAEEFDVDSERAAKDVHSFVNELVALELLEKSE